VVLPTAVLEKKTGQKLKRNSFIRNHCLLYTTYSSIFYYSLRHGAGKILMRLKCASRSAPCITDLFSTDITLWNNFRKFLNASIVQ